MHPYLILHNVYEGIFSLSKEDIHVPMQCSIVYYDLEIKVMYCRKDHRTTLNIHVVLWLILFLYGNYQTKFIACKFIYRNIFVIKNKLFQTLTLPPSSFADITCFQKRSFTWNKLYLVKSACKSPMQSFAVHMHLNTCIDCMYVFLA